MEQEKSPPLPVMSWNAALREHVQSVTPNWLLRHQMQVNSALGIAALGTLFMASGAADRRVLFNPYRAALLPLGLASKGIGLAFTEPDLTQTQIEQRKGMPFGEHLRESLAESLDARGHPLKTRGVLALAMAGLHVAAYRHERSGAFWGELLGAASAGSAAGGFLLARDPATSWQVYSLAGLATLPLDIIANRNLIKSDALNAQVKGRWLLARTALSGSAHVMGYLLGGANVTEHAAPQPRINQAEAGGTVMVPPPARIRE